MVYRHYRRPNIRAVAILADVSCRRVSWAFAGRVGAIVTTDTVARDTCVVEIRG